MNAIKKLSAMTALVLTLVAPQFSQAEAYKTVRLHKNLNVGDSETKSVDLGRYVYIKNLVIQAQGASTDSTIEVLVNGQTKGTIYAPGYDPSYIVTIEDSTSSIQFRHRSGGAMSILDIMVVVSDVSDIDSPEAADSVDGLAYSVIRLVDRLVPYSTLDEERNYLTPLKIKAANVYVMNAAHGQLSISTRRALQDLQGQLVLSDLYINELLQQQAFFDVAVDLLTIKETIKDLLN